ncbi:hypothetical protein COT54_02090 [Candidatus Collierbacteria bacterium CG09_land_8_20_14_0_10_46_12]|uniref:Antitoxin n=1 Tax=Candidatus Collierbacteria bacterium CG09_land_8_20_14_0_10_46_12 TaxID=1974533 RepID=A0A2H0WZ22_9BACT|nr:MAG: hypothetical protein COT54_02090 [Candidatus Collierbacteria bacterium CG09_land_8_20_14_0_10_46_12]
MNTTRVTVADFRNNMSDYMNRARYGDEIIVIEKWGKVPLRLEQMVEKKQKNAKSDKAKARIERIKALNATFGMWADREDMKDSVKWVQDLRKKEESRYANLLG